MNRYIKLSDAIKSIEDLPDCYNGFSDAYDKSCIIGVLEELPSADVVPVVRCKDCFHSRPDGYGLECTMHYRPTKEEDFCSYGEMR